MEGFWAGDRQEEQGREIKSPPLSHTLQQCLPSRHGMSYAAGCAGDAAQPEAASATLHPEESGTMERGGQLRGEQGSGGGGGVGTSQPLLYSV